MQNIEYIINDLKNKKLIQIIKEEFKLDFYGDHGIYHWYEVYKNTQTLSSYYGIQSEVFELFSILHDSKREDEYKDPNHGYRASLFVKELTEKNIINLSKEDENRLIYACANHTKSDKKDILYKDLVVQICFDSDRLDIKRVGIEPSSKYMTTIYAKKLIEQEEFKSVFI